jgi:hypothetical protein
MIGATLAWNGYSCCSLLYAGSFCMKRSGTKLTRDTRPGKKFQDGNSKGGSIIPHVMPATRGVKVITT